MNTIETERLVLRRFAPQDAAGLFAYLQAPIASCFLSLTLADLNDAARAVAERGADDKSIAVCLRSTGQLIGDLFAEPEGDTFSVGWNFNPQYAGRGYAHEAASALFADLFTRRAARRLYAYVEDTNTSSQKLCERLGMRQEGAFKEFVSFKNDDSEDSRTFVLRESTKVDEVVRVVTAPAPMIHVEPFHYYLIDTFRKVYLTPELSGVQKKKK